MTNRQLVLVHGRAQEHKDAAELKREWLAALTATRPLPVPAADVRFPYYGQALFDLTGGADRVAEVVVKGAQDDADPAELAWTASIVAEVARRAGVTEDEIVEAGDADVLQKGPLNWPWVRATLTVIDRRVPLGSGGGIALFTRDVYRYLRNPGIRDVIETGVRQALRPGVPAVVVSHSLGTVVAYNLLRREGTARGWDVPLFVTLGSPLAVTAIKRSLAPIAHPACVGHWFNAMDGRDLVALYPLDRDTFPVDPPVENKTDVDNHTPNRHGIAGYLGDAEVAGRICGAL